MQKTFNFSMLKSPVREDEDIGPHPILDPGMQTGAFSVDDPVGHEGNEGSNEGGSTSSSQLGDESHEVNRVGSQEKSSHMDGQ